MQAEARRSGQQSAESQARHALRPLGPMVRATRVCSHLNTVQREALNQSSVAAMAMPAAKDVAVLS